ncbi:hypothetical protein [Sulfitobacter sediminilitoris]|uniref:hypothetical protein n=1 Tax=Sulfitobacter sediminilitoris TaxID=2698830 RepID=UPI003607B29C
MKRGELNKAEATIGKIEQGVAKALASKAATTEKPQTETADTPDPKALMARAGSLKKALDQSKSADTKLVKTILLQALILLKAHDFVGADNELTAAENMLSALSEAPAKGVREGDNNEQNDQTVADKQTANVEATYQEDAHDQDAEQDRETDPDAASQEQAEWEATLGPLQAEVDAAMDEKSGDLDSVNLAFNFAKSQATSKDFAGALRAAETTRKRIKDAAEAIGEARSDETAGATPDNVVAYLKSRLNWINTRNGLYADVVKLKMTIDAKVREIEGMEDIAQNTSMLVDYLEDLDSTLEDKLNALVETPGGAEREKLKQDSIKIIRDYRSTLDGAFFQAVDQNGFTDTKIRARALDALSEVETALAA